MPPAQRDGDVEDQPRPGEAGQVDQDQRKVADRHAVREPHRISDERHEPHRDRGLAGGRLSRRAWSSSEIAAVCAAARVIISSLPKSFAVSCEKAGHPRARASSCSRYPRLPSRGGRALVRAPSRRDTSASRSPVEDRIRDPMRRRAQRASRRAAARRAFLNPDGRRYTAGRDAGWSSLVARRAHNPEVAGSNPAPATGKAPETGLFRSLGRDQRRNSCPTFGLWPHSTSDQL